MLKRPQEEVEVGQLLPWLALAGRVLALSLLSQSAEERCRGQRLTD